MQVYAMKLHNFLRFGEVNNTIVFDLTAQQKKAIAIGETSMDDIYASVTSDPIGHINRAKRRGLESQIGIIGLVNGDPGSSNGVGKSTLMEAICYAHYEKIVRKTANSDKIEKSGLSVVTKLDGKYPKGMSESYVEEYFEDNGCVYRIKRGKSFSKNHITKTPIAEFECIGKEEIDNMGSHRTGDTKDSISDVITMDYDVFVNSQMFGQSDAGKYLTGTDKVKKEMLISLLRLENVVIGCLELLRKKKNAQEKKVSSIKSNIEFLEGMFCKAYAKYMEEDQKAFETSMPDGLLKKLDEVRSRANARIVLCDQKTVEIQEEMDVLTKSDKLKNIDRIKEDIKRVQVEKESKMADRNQRLSDWDELKKSVASEVDRIGSEINSKTNRIAKECKLVDEVKKQIDGFDLSECGRKLEIIDKAKAEKPVIEEKLSQNIEKREELVKGLAGLKTRVQSAQDEIGALQGQIEHIKDGEDFTCDKCKSKVSKEHVLAEIKKNQDIIDVLSSDMGRDFSKKTKMEDEISNLRVQISKIDKYIVAEGKIVGEIETNKAVQERLKSMLANQKTLEEEVAGLKEQLKVAETKRTEYTLKVEEIALKFDVDIAAIDKRIERVQNDFTNAKQEAKEVEDKIAEHKAMIEKISTAKTEASERLGFLDREIGAHNQLRVQLDGKRTEYIEEFKVFNRYELLESVYGLDGIQTRIVKKYLPLLNVYIKEFLDILSRGTIGVKMVINDKSKIDMVITGAGADSYEMLSGGEKMIVRLAVDIGMALLAFSRSAQKPEIVCLDEIFAPLDNNNVEAVFKMLERLQDKFSRVIIITHDPQIQERLKSNIIIEKGAGALGMSEIRRIE